jgi:hypothetical protein
MCESECVSVCECVRGYEHLRTSHPNVQIPSQRQLQSREPRLSVKSRG